jgi:hypothetical protein
MRLLARKVCHQGKPAAVAKAPLRHHDRAATTR